MSSRRWYLWVIVLSITTTCVVLGLVFTWVPSTLSVENIFGTYVASYPFGTATITLNPDGTFVQRVEVTGDPPPTTAKGRWTFDSDSYNKNYVTFYDGYLSVDDGFGRLKSDWRKEQGNSVAVPPIGRAFYKILLNPEGKYPYVKQ
jgi:hypothetical protein